MKAKDIKFYRYKMMISHNGNLQMIWYKDVIYLKAEGDYTDIVVSNTNIVYSTTMALKDFEDCLPSKVFFRCHRSIIVNITYIERVDKSNTIHTYSKMRLPLARSRQQLLKEVLLEPDRLKAPQCGHCPDCGKIDTCEVIRPFSIHR